MPDYAELLSGSAPNAVKAPAIKSVIDERLLPHPGLLSEAKRRAVTRLAFYEAWAWYQAMSYWFPGHVGWVVRWMFCRPFLQRTGRGCQFAEFCSVRPPNRFQKGDLSVLSRFGVINAPGGANLGDHFGIGSFSQVIAVNHAFETPDFSLGAQAHRLDTAPVVIESSVWIGAGCTLLPGVRAGTHSMVAARAVVTRDVPPCTLVGGVPTRVIRDFRQDERMPSRRAGQGEGVG